MKKFEDPTINVVSFVSEVITGDESGGLDGNEGWTSNELEGW